MVLFSDNAENIFFLDSFSNNGDVSNAISNLPYLNGATNTQAGIVKMLEEQFVANRGDRADATNVAVVITDGESTVDSGNTLPAAGRAKGAGIEIISIGEPTYLC